MRTLTLFLIVVLIFSCSQKKTDLNYYVLSQNDYDTTWIYDSNNDQYYPPPPPPPPPHELSWYANVVIIFDTAYKVFLYQTECIYKEKELRKSCVYPSRHYPNFIGLNPNQVLTLNSDYLIDFFEDNDRYFKFDTNYHDSHRFIFIVSDFDTIRNIAYYNLMKHIRSDIKRYGRVLYTIRRATEEEKEVLSCLRTGNIYDPKNLNWSTNFIDGETKPFTSRYDSLEQKLYFTIKSKEIFKPELTNIRPIQ